MDWDKRKSTTDTANQEPIKVLDEGDIAILKAYSQAAYAQGIKTAEQDIKAIHDRIAQQTGLKEIDTGLAPQHLWDLQADQQRMRSEEPLQVARCTKIIEPGKKYLISIKQYAKFVVELGKDVAEEDIEEELRRDGVK